MAAARRVLRLALLGAFLLFASSFLLPSKAEAPPRETPSPTPPASSALEQYLQRPPADFFELYRIVPFSIHDKDKAGNYVAYVVSDNIDWDLVGDVDSARIREYITYLSVLFWTRVDPRPDGQLTVVVDASGFTFKRVVGGAVKTVLTAIAQAINEVAAVVGSRGGAVIFINSPRILGPLLSLISTLLRKNVRLVSYSSRSSWEPALKELVASENLPVEYGGESPVPLEHSAVSRKILEMVLSYSDPSRLIEAGP